MRRTCLMAISTLLMTTIGQSATSNPAASVNKAAVDGTFQILADEQAPRSKRAWQELMAELRESGLNHIVIQWLQFDGSPNNYADQLEALLNACRNEPLSLMIGLSLSSTWWSESSLQTDRLQQELADNIQVATSVASMLRDHPCFIGWYIPHEAEATALTEQQDAALLQFYSQLSKALKRLTPGKLVSASGYHQSKQIDGFDPVYWWRNLVETAGIDRLYFQDGRGVIRLAPLAVSDKLIQELAKVLPHRRTELWIVIEAFEQLDPGSQDSEFRAIATTPQRLCQQVQQMQSLAAPMILFTFADYMRGPIGSRAADLGEHWRRTQGCRSNHTDYDHQAPGR